MSKGKGRVLVCALSVAALCVLTALLQSAAHISPPFCRDALCRPLSVFTREERLAGGVLHQLPALEDGDILVTDCTHTFGWRHGHAALVVDAGAGLALEAVTLGVPSALRPVEAWRGYPTFQVLRLKDASSQTRKAIADNALNSLQGIPYRLTGGLLGEKGATPLSGSQCAHLVWYAYHRFSYDLDGDGGRLVTVDDLRRSPLLETVAILG